ncbi:MAG: hypothetical protein ABR523_02765 [Desulfurivibrionaceae bacterium]
MQTEKVLIDKVVTGGLGLGRMADGMVFMIPYVLPGEEVLIRPGRRKKIIWKPIWSKLSALPRAGSKQIVPILGFAAAAISSMSNTAISLN